MRVQVSESKSRLAAINHAACLALNLSRPSLRLLIRFGRFRPVVVSPCRRVALSPLCELYQQNTAHNNMLISGYTFCVNARACVSSLFHTHSLPLSLTLNLSIFLFLLLLALSAIRWLNKTNNDNNNNSNNASGVIVPSGVDWQRVACGVWHVACGRLVG